MTTSSSDQDFRSARPPGGTSQQTTPRAPLERPGAEEFSLWCAMNDRPFRLRLFRWQDGSDEWCVEAYPGTPASTVIYGTGSDDESTAVVLANGPKSHESR